MKRRCKLFSIAVSVCMLALGGCTNGSPGVNKVNKAAQLLRNAGSGKLTAVVAIKGEGDLEVFTQTYNIELVFSEQGNKIFYMSGYKVDEQPGNYRQFYNGSGTYQSKDNQPWQVVENAFETDRQNLPMPLESFFYGIAEKDAVTEEAVTQLGEDTQVKIKGTTGAVNFPYADILGNRPINIDATYLLAKSGQFKNIQITGMGDFSAEGNKSAITFNISVQPTEIGKYGKVTFPDPTIPPQS